MNPKDFHSAPEVVPSQDPEYYATPNPKSHGSLELLDQKYDEPAKNLNPLKRQKVFGLRPKIFWILVLVMVVISAAAIGGGVGAGLAAQNKRYYPPTIQSS